MASRFPTDKAPANASDIMEDALNLMHGGNIPFFWKEDDGQFVGPYAPLAYSPDIVKEWFTIAKACYKPSVVKPRNRELATLGLCSIIKAPYVLYCHRNVAAKLGLTSEQADAAAAGITPEGLSEEEAMAYKLGRVLTTLTGPLDDETWEEAAQKLGKSEVVGITHIIGAYKWVSLLVQLNKDDREWT